MIGSGTRKLATVLSAGMILGTAGAASAEKPLKELMGENFGGLQTILYALISANYGAVPEQADVIIDHAQQLTDMVPESAKDERMQFLAYANNLGAHAADMKSISKVLMERDKARAESSTDYLREALAAHYGGMVTMCVACHNRFRPLPAQ